MKRKDIVSQNLAKICSASYSQTDMQNNTYAVMTHSAK